MADVTSTVTRREEIAIVGMAGRFPGARSIDELWKNLCAGVDATVSFSPAELAHSGVDPAVADLPGYVNRGTALDEADAFDAAFFGYHPREAALMDPQHRLFLECAWAALEHAGYDVDRLDSLVGVFGGVARNTYFTHNLITRRDVLDVTGAHQMLIASDKDFPATRVSFKLNLRGPSLNVQTACSSSGVAIHLACQSLLAGECDMAIAGGGRVKVPLRAGYVYEEGGILSPDGRCRPFDARARGTVLGSGMAMVVLKRLSDALVDHDTVYAVIKATAINNDGAAKVGFTAPSIEGQARVIAEALALAEAPADSVSYVETHGTATAIGDPIEIAALTDAFRRTTRGRGFCAIGSIKANIGHLDAGAGAAGVIKTALALTHRLIPPSINFDTPNPEIDFDASPFFVSTALTPWAAGATPRRAGVSSFGLGGTNAHIVLEEPPVRPAAAADGAARPDILVLSARTEGALDRACRQLATHLESTPDADLPDVAWTLQTGRKAFEHRAAVVARTAADAAGHLRSADARRRAAGRRVEPFPSPVFLFPGGGVQYPNMGREIYEREPVYRREIDRCLTRLHREYGLDLRPLLFPAPADVECAQRALERPTSSILSIFVTEYALARLWMSWGIQPAAMTGHSLGEYTAACLAGVLSLDDALAVVKARGDIFETIDEGAMLSVPLSETDVRAWLADRPLSIAAINGPALCSVSGTTSVIDAFERDLAARDIEATRIRISVAAHSALLDPRLEEFSARLAGIRFSPPTIPFISNLSGGWAVADEVTDRAYWVRHLRHTVRFSDGVRTLANPQRVFIEVGPGVTMCSLLRLHAGGEQGPPIIASMRHPQDGSPDLEVLAGALGRAWVAGLDVDWAAVHLAAPRRRVGLPTYPFERTRCWLDRGETGTAGAEVQAPQTDLPDLTAATVAPHEAMPPAQARETPVTLDRQTLICQEIARVLGRLSGTDASVLDPSRSFLELGFDSLFLGQASMAFQKTFGVKLRFRDLLETAPTPATLAALLDARLPPDKFAPAPPDGATMSAAHGVEPGPPSPAARPATRDAATTPIKVFAPAVATVQSSVAWQPVEHGADGGVTPRQHEALNDLIRRYSARTARSRQIVDEMRPHLADPRSVVGFAPLWKETVYQIVIERSRGGRIWDVDGNEWIDVTLGFGAAAFGHSPAFVMDALRRQLEHGIEVGAQSPLSAQVATLFCEITGHDRVCFCTAGTEAVMGAMRLARAHTGRDRIAMFVGDTHGRVDEVLGRPILTNNELTALPIAAGIAPHAVKPTLFLDYGDPRSLDTIARYADELAAVLVEPVRTRSPDLQPIEFLRALRTLTAERGIAFIMDEVVTGFRVHHVGAQRLFGIEPDLSTWGKAVAGGMPIGLISGKAAYMDALDGGAWHFGDDSVPEAAMTNFGGGGTFAKHPLSLAAALATLEYLKAAGPSLQEQTAARAARFVDTLNRRFRDAGRPIHLERFSTFWAPRVLGDRRFEPLLFVYLRQEGIHTYLDYPCFICTAHTDEDIDELVARFTRAVDAMAEAGFLSRPPQDRSRPLDAGRTSAAALVGATQGSDRGLVRELALTPAQQEIWLAAQLGDDASAAFNVSSSVDLTGALDLEALRRAVQQTVGRHEALRVSVPADGSIQRINDGLVLDVPLVDLSAVAGAEQARRLASFVAEDVARPFDLGIGPLVRFTVVRLDEGRHRLIVTAFHMVCDGWSMGIIIKDLGAFYTAAVDGAPPALRPAISFGEYLAWREEPGQLADQDESEAYWLAQFADGAPVLELPIDAPRPRVKTYRAGQRATTFDTAVFADLRHAAGRRGCTTFAMSLSAFALLLHRLTGQDEVVVGLGAAGQAAVGDDTLVGHAVNLLPFRSRVSAEATVQDYVAAIRSALLDAYDHQSCTYGTIVSKLKLTRDAGRVPLISVSVTHETDTPGIRFSGLEHQVVVNPKRHCHFDLELYLTESKSSLSASFSYNADLFTDETIDRWLGHFRVLVAALARAALADDPMPARRLPLLEADQHRELVADRSAGPIAAPPEDRRPLHRFFEAQARRVPDRVALVLARQEVTYADLDRRANRIAHHLRRQGCGPGTLVGLYVDRSLELVAGLLGILKAGAAYVPIDTLYPADRVRFMIDDAGLQALLTTSTLAAGLPAHRATVVCFDTDGARIDREPDTTIADDVPDEALAYVIYTSGSTGQPKGTLVTHRSVVRLLQVMQPLFGFTERDVWTIFHSHAFDFSVWEIWGALFHGGRAVVVPYTTSRSPDEFGDLLVDEGVTVLNQTPSAFKQFIEAERRRTPGALALRYVIFGGEALDPQSLKPWFDRHGDERPRLVNMYGITETTVFTTYRPLSIADLARSGVGSPIGRPLPDWRVYLLDPLQQPVPIGVTGELYVGGAGVARGYLNRDALTRERFLADPFSADPDARLYRSGDLARQLPDRDLEYLGRADHQVKLRGFRVELGEIEAVLTRHPAVGQAAVVARGETADERHLVAYIVPRDGAAPGMDELHAHVKNVLPDYMVPTAWVSTPRLPLTSNGKLDTRALPPPASHRPEDAAALVAPRTPTEQGLASLWRELLKVPAVGVRDDFFLLGGHSLLAMQLMTRVHEMFNVRLTPGALFECPVLEDLARRVNESLPRAAVAPVPSLSPALRPATPQRVLVPITTGGAGTPFFWAHGVGGEVFAYAPLSRHLAPDRPVYGFAADWTETEGGAPLTVEGMAAHYVKELCAVQPSGPYYLGGYCSAAMVAFEIARQLEQAGHHVGILVAIDADIRPAGRPRHNLALTTLAFLENLPRWVRDDAGPSGPKELAGRVRSRLSHVARRLRTNGHGEAAGQVVDVRDQLGMWRFPDYQVPMLAAHHQAIKRYRPQPIQSPVVLFLPRAAPLFRPWAHEYDPEWDRLAPHVRVLRVPGSHSTLLKEPHVSVLAALLNQCLREVEGQTADPVNGQARVRLQDRARPVMSRRG